MFFPLSGPGGRLGVHSVSNLGRFPTNIPSIVCGATIVDFELDPFNSLKVFIASDDSKIRVFELENIRGIEEDFGETKLILEGELVTKNNNSNSNNNIRNVFIK